MRTFHVYSNGSNSLNTYLGTVTAPTLVAAQRAVEAELLMPCIVRFAPPPPPTLEHRVGTDGRLYRH